MQLISKFNKRFRFLLCVIDTFSKYAWVVPLKDKKGVSILNAFQSILKDSNSSINVLLYCAVRYRFHRNSKISLP